MLQPLALNLLNSGTATGHLAPSHILATQMPSATLPRGALVAASPSQWLVGHPLALRQSLTSCSVVAHSCNTHPVTAASWNSALSVPFRMRKSGALKRIPRFRNGASPDSSLASPVHSHRPLPAQSYYESLRHAPSSHMYMQSMANHEPRATPAPLAWHGMAWHGCVLGWRSPNCFREEHGLASLAWPIPPGDWTLYVVYLHLRPFCFFCVSAMLTKFLLSFYSACRDVHDSAIPLPSPSPVPSAKPQQSHCSSAIRAPLLWFLGSGLGLAPPSLHRMHYCEPSLLRREPGGCVARMCSNPALISDASDSFCSRAVSLPMLPPALRR